jgi:hypothetical protein
MQGNFHSLQHPHHPDSHVGHTAGSTHGPGPPPGWVLPHSFSKVLLVIDKHHALMLLHWLKMKPTLSYSAPPIRPWHLRTACSTSPVDG